MTPKGASRSDVSFLGTGSAVPSKYRNVTGMLVRLSPSGASEPASSPPVGSAAAVAAQESGSEGGGWADARVAAVGGDASRSLGGGDGASVVDEAGDVGGEGSAGGAFEGGSILLDAGEGSFGQLWRMFGESSSSHSRSTSSSGDDKDGAAAAAASASGINTRAQQMLRDLSAVWISHPHADHHLGLVRILSERNKLLRGDSVTGAMNGGLGGALGGAAAGTGASLPNLLLMAPAPVADWLKVSELLCGRQRGLRERCFLLKVVLLGKSAWWFDGATCL